MRCVSQIIRSRSVAVLVTIQAKALLSNVWWRATQEEDEAVGPRGTGAAVLREGRALQSTLLSNRAEAFLRAKPPRLAEAAASAKAALQIDPNNEKAQRWLERADPNSSTGTTKQMKGNGSAGARRNGTARASRGAWRGVLVQAAKKSGAQAIALLILLAAMAIIQAVSSPLPSPRFVPISLA
jgi:hypothetical protein